MKRILACAAAVALAIGAAPLPSTADVVEREVTEKTTTRYTGTVTRVDPAASTIVVRSQAAEPQTYTYNKQTTFVDEAGNTVTYEAIQNRPVTVHYSKQGDTMIVSKVEVTKGPGGVIERRETTTETQR